MSAFKIPAGIECPDWEPLPSNLDSSGNSKSKLCRYYLAPNSKETSPRGLCSIPKNFSCIEWDRRNPNLVPLVRPSGLSSTNDPSPPSSAPRQGALPMAMAGAGSEDTSKAPRGTGKPGTAGPRKLPLNQLPDPGPDVLVSIKPEQLEQLKASKCEVQLKSDEPTIGDVWLVPELTGRDRMELTYDSAATIRMIADVFPGARVVGLRKADAYGEDE